MVENMNRAPDPGSAPAKVVSLFPPMTDSMTVLGLDRFLAGISNACPVLASHAAIPRMGPPADPRTAEIIRCKPDLVMVCPEETPSAVIEELDKAGLRVWSMHPRTVRGAVADLRDLVLMYASESALQSVVWMDRTLDWLEGSRPEKGVRVFCPRAGCGTADPAQTWITAGGGTYADDLLSLCGGENIFAEKEGGSNVRVSAEEAAAAKPEVILLPEEEFAVSSADAAALQRGLSGSPAVRKGRIRRVDGRMLFWPGWRLGDAVQTLPDLMRIDD
jgi:iron complex transport system substrate-binding protein